MSKAQNKKIIKPQQPEPEQLSEVDTEPQQ